MAQALVPLKDLVQAKTRLAGILRPSERRALAQAMAEDVLSILAAHPHIDRITLVSDDPAGHLLAAQYGAQHWTEQALGCRGLNSIVERASRRLLAAGPSPLLVLHADLPLLQAADLDAVLGAWRRAGGLVVACDAGGSGTNLLCFDAGSLPDFAFGPDSCHAHAGWARDRAVPVSVLRCAGLALDVDEPRDLAAFLDSAAPGAVYTRALIHARRLEPRVRLALGSLRPREAAPVGDAGREAGGC